MGTIANLQKALNACEDSNAELEVQNTVLKNQMRSMNMSIKAMEQYRTEMDEIRAALAESQMANSSLKAQNNKLQKENKVLSNVIGASNNEMSDVLFASDTNKKKIVDLTQHIKALEKQLEQTTVELEEQGQIIINKKCMIDQQKASLEEMNAIELNLKARIKDLENQLEMALITGRGSFLKQDGTATENQLSLADELGQLSGFQNSASPPLYQVEFDDDVELDESAEFEVDVMERSHVKALADELKEALDEDTHKEKEEAVTCKSMEMTLRHGMEESRKHEEVDEVINHVEVKEEVTDETVEMDISCEEMVKHEMREAQEPEVMEQLIRQGDIHESIKLEMGKAEFNNYVDSGAERPVRAQISLLEEENKPDEKSSVCLEQTHRSFQRAALVTGAIGLGLLIFLKIKA
ncbi:kinesin-like protein KIF15-A isoform X1 [Alosa alosa]|nr:kinesin-like protein KIF15-A isoform X1 [Alosa alosa]